MKRILGVGLLMALFCLPLVAAKNSQAFLLPPNVRVGDTQLPEGRYDVTWTEPSGSQVQLTFKTEDKKKTITVPATLVQEAQSKAGMQTVFVNGVLYLQEVHTTKVKFVIQGAPNEVK